MFRTWFWSEAYECCNSIAGVIHMKSLPTDWESPWTLSWHLFVWFPTAIQNTRYPHTWRWQSVLVWIWETVRPWCFRCEVMKYTAQLHITIVPQDIYNHENPGTGLEKISIGRIFWLKTIYTYCLLFCYWSFVFLRFKKLTKKQNKRISKFVVRTSELVN